MKNLSLYADSIQKSMNVNRFTDISDLTADVLILFDRIKELERALGPFARQAKMDNFGRETTTVYFKDCVAADEVLSRENGHPLQRRHRNSDTVEYPAE